MNSCREDSLSFPCGPAACIQSVKNIPAFFRNPPCGQKPGFLNCVACEPQGHTKRGSWRKLLIEKAFRTWNDQDWTQNPAPNDPSSSGDSTATLLVLACIYFLEAGGGQHTWQRQLAEVGSLLLCGTEDRTEIIRFLASTFSCGAPSLATNAGGEHSIHTLQWVCSCDTPYQCTLPETVSLSWDSVHYALQSLTGHTKLPIKSFSYRKYFK